MKYVFGKSFDGLLDVRFCLSRNIGTDEPDKRLLNHRENQRKEARQTTVLDGASTLDHWTDAIDFGNSMSCNPVFSHGKRL